MAGRKTVWDLLLQIDGKDHGASAAMRQVKRQMQDMQAASKQLKGDFSAFTKSAGKLALGLVGGVTAATVAVVKMASDVANTGDQVAKTSKAIGIGIEAYQGLQYAMQQSGVSAEEFDGALKKFNQTVRLGAAGNAAARKQLEAIGLSADKLSKMKPEEAFLTLSNYMKSLPNDAARTQVAITMFGKAAGPRMMAAMKEGSGGIKKLMNEAKSLGIVLTDSQAHQSEAYVDALTKLKKSGQGLKTQFITGAIGPLTKAFETLSGAVMNNLPAIQELGRKFGEWLGDVVDRLPEIIAKIKEMAAWLWENITRLKDMAGGWQNVAKIAGAVVIAPTAVKGLRVVNSLVVFIKTAVKALPAILAGMKGAFVVLGAAAKGAFATIAAAAAPIAAIIAAIVIVVIVIIRRFQDLKKYVLEAFGSIKQTLVEALGPDNPIFKVIDAIKSFFGGGEASEGVKKFGEVAKQVLGVVWNIIENVVLVMLKQVINVLAAAIKIFIGVFKVAFNIIKGIIMIPIAIVKIIIALFKGGFKGAIVEVKSQFKQFGDVFNNIFGGIKIVVTSVIDFFKSMGNNLKTMLKDILGDEKFQALATFFTGIGNAIKNIFSSVGSFFTSTFTGAINGVKSIIEGLVGVFTSVFDKIKGLITSVVDYFTGKFATVKDFFASVGDFFKGGGGKDKMASHAAGGIFTQRHIAQIAESGAEAVVPLNNTPNGYRIWKQAGEMGGYLQTTTQGVAVAKVAAQGVARVGEMGGAEPDSPPITKAAAASLTRNEGGISINFTQSNTFTGGTPDQAVVKQIADAGKKAADDLEKRLEQIMRDKRRVSFA